MSTDDKRALQREQGRRLKAARKQLGLATAVKAAEFLKVSPDTYYAHENGNRGMGRAAEDYAAKFGVSEEWLLRGRNPPIWAQPDVESDAGTDPVPTEHFLGAWRRHAKLSHQDLADRLGVPLQLVEDWESGRADISGTWLRRLATIFSTTPGSILDVDPGTVPPDLLEIWRDTAARQAEVRTRISTLRGTGTDG